jgi:hypothetical protein
MIVFLKGKKVSDDTLEEIFIKAELQAISDGAGMNYAIHVDLPENCSLSDLDIQILSESRYSFPGSTAICYNVTPNIYHLLKKFYIFDTSWATMEKYKELTADRSLG